MTPLQILVHEHRLIRQFLDQIGFAIERLERGILPSRRFWEDAVAFAREFADKHHHHKEEHLMFGRLAVKMDGELDAAVLALRYQHNRCRALIAAIDSEISGYADGDGKAFYTVLESAAAYRALLTHHVNNEDHVFYPMVKSALDEAEMNELSIEFSKAAAVGDGDVLERNVDRLDRMAKLIGD